MKRLVWLGLVVYFKMIHHRNKNEFNSVQNEITAEQAAIINYLSDYFLIHSMLLLWKEFLLGL